MPRPLNTFLINFLSGMSGETHTTVKFSLKNGQFRRFATANIEISGEEYFDSLIFADGISEAEDASTDRTEVRIQNADKVIGLEVQAGLYNFADVSIGTVFRRLDGTFEWQEKFFGQALPSAISEKEVSIEVVDEMVAASYCVTNFTLAPICQLIFKSAACGYSGAETSCNKLLKGDCTKYERTFRHVSETFPLIRNSEAPVSGPTQMENLRYETSDDALARWKDSYSGAYWEV